MNYGMIRYILGKMLQIEGVLLLFPAFVSLLYREQTGIWFVVTAGLLFLLALSIGRKPKDTIH